MPGRGSEVPAGKHRNRCSLKVIALLPADEGTPLLDAQSVAALVSAFDDTADGAATKSRELILMLLRHSAEPFSRAQFAPGHITCTGLVVDPDAERILLVHHRRLDRWLLPGGHVEPGDAAVWDAARREVVEETGAVLAADGIPTLVNVDVHGIPGRAAEPYHQHHDLVFRFQALTCAVAISAESRDIAWAAPEEFDAYDLPANVRRSCARLRG
jgi:8-oxo-dGTP pyrophosphatase MutT (NUDIX family)